jgi:multiple antibiotic resistance protein
VIIRLRRVVFFAACVLVALNFAYLLTGGLGNEALSSFNGTVMNNYSPHTDKIIYTPNVHQNHQRADFQLGDSELDGLRKALSISDTLGYDTLKSTIALFVVIDPIGTVPLFIALTEKMEEKERIAVSKTAVITSGILLMVFAIAGTQILAIFGITIYSFMVAGGILLFIVAIELLTHGIWRFGAGASGESGIVPLAFPLLAGPGAITSVIISFQTDGLIVTLLSVTIVIGATYLILRSVKYIYKLIGRRGAMIVTRVFAVFVAAIAVQYIIEGIKHLFM